MANMTLPRLLTVGRLAQLLRVPPGRIYRLLRKHPNIVPAALAGNTAVKLYDRRAEARLRYLINLADAQRAKGVAQ